MTSTSSKGNVTRKKRWTRNQKTAVVVPTSFQSERKTAVDTFIDALGNAGVIKAS